MSGKQASGMMYLGGILNCHNAHRHRLFFNSSPWDIGLLGGFSLSNKQEAHTIGILPSFQTRVVCIKSVGLPPSFGFSLYLPLIDSIANPPSTCHTPNTKIKRN